MENYIGIIARDVASVRCPMRARCLMEIQAFEDFEFAFFTGCVM